MAWLIARRTWRSLNCGTFSLKNSRSTAQDPNASSTSDGSAFKAATWAGGTAEITSTSPALELLDTLVVVGDVAEVDLVEIGLSGLPVVLVPRTGPRCRP